ncbi:hypothetical protein [Pseudoduganella albidiflava]|uniref:Uncharacterized protein n=1 Tax=Pseudoduganella albidiflava TaxID=321983 RepID=A0A411X377_9BURK|nr:hypothetical protein [Pseudoduganella albidiflava]QBI03486.1 hypothetical protein EYF70_23670 [Pseudoduganella albidiflava]GGY50393.1 hypothetical protein GCM10007387_35890 [Pseudoduganella albidiflava]
MRAEVKRSFLVLLAIAASAAFSQGTQAWEWLLRPAETRYVIYGGELGDTIAPTPDNARVAFYVRGRAAKDMFEAMGPDRKAACGVEKGVRIRERDNLACLYRPTDGYQCDFGFNLRTGKSIGASIC